MNKICRRVQQVQEFHAVGGHPIQTQPTKMSVDRYLKRMQWIVDELEEGLLAAQKGDMDGFLDALTDAEYFLLGTVVEAGLQELIVPKFDDVHEANMSKFPETLEDALKTILQYKEKDIATEFKKVTTNNKDYYVVYFTEGNNAGKIAKAWNWREPKKLI